MKVAVIGLGTIGMRWVARFCAAGLDVTAWDASSDAVAQCRTGLPALLADVAALRPGPRPTDPRFAASLQEAVSDVAFVQENTPERIDLKRSVLAQIDAAAPAEAIIASSSSALLVSEMQRGCAHPERVVLGHPLNPAHLMPLVEVVGGENTSRAAVERARAFYEGIGAKPVVLNREIPGYLALRLGVVGERERAGGGADRPSGGGPGLSSARLSTRLGCRTESCSSCRA